METSREDVGIAIRSALLRRGAQQRFSLFVLVIFSVTLMFFDKIQLKQIDYLRSIVKDVIFRGSVIVGAPSKSIGNISNQAKEHFNLFNKYTLLKDENEFIKRNKKAIKNTALLDYRKKRLIIKMYYLINV